MSFAPPPQPLSLLPESAPFTPAQRAWLNGFFAGLISVDGSAVTPLSAADSAALVAGALAQPKDPLAEGDDGEAPWHDQTLPLAERMKRAEGRPLRRRLMAAMAQQDCGQCGYNCQDYSEAISRKTEERLNLCVPGGKETARMLKTLYAEFGAQPAPVAKTAAPAVSAEAAAPAVAAPAVAVPPVASGRARQSGDRHLSVSRATQQARLRQGDLARRARPEGFRRRLCGGGFHRHISGQRSRPRRCGDCGARRAGGFSDRRPHAARGSDRRRFARTGARYAVPALLLHHRRRAAAGREGAFERGKSRRRRRHARRAGRNRKIPRHPSRSRGLHRGARSVAAAALFDQIG